MAGVVVDASVLVSGFLSDEAQMEEARRLADAYGDGHLNLVGPTVLPHELTNAVLKAVRKERITSAEAEGILARYASFGLALYPVDAAHVYSLAQRFGRSAYDAAYLALAEQEGVPLITADERLYNAVRATLPWVVWLPEWRGRIELETPRDIEGAEHE